MPGDVIRSKIAGVTFTNGDGTRRQDLIRAYCRPGLRLGVVIEWDNPHATESAAIALCLEDGRQLGYVRNNDRLVARLLAHLVGGGSLEVRVLQVTGGEGDKENLGVNIEIRLLSSSEKPRPAGHESDDSWERALSAETQPAGYDFNASRKAPDGCLAGCLPSLLIVLSLPITLPFAAIRRAPAAYRRLPEWARPIVWGLGAGLAFLLLVILLRSGRK
ncbi:hypothetical protein [Singulisphaera sp. PoT]|uniref:hypothetical protein n=1 Tax=Singulisphaera sp. PoT TaxID=3411797 RepID=UPI003BF48A1B